MQKILQMATQLKRLQSFTFKKFKGSAASGRNVADFVFCAPLGTNGGSVSAADDGGSLARPRHNGVHQLPCSVGNVFEFEHARGAVNEIMEKLNSGMLL